MSFSSITADSICREPGFKVGDRVRIRADYNFPSAAEWSGKTGLIRAEDRGYWIIVMEDEPRSPWYFPDSALEPAPARLLTADEMLARMKARQRDLIAGAKYSMAPVTINVSPGGQITAKLNQNRMPVDLKWCDGQANTSGTKRDFETGGLRGFAAVLDNAANLVNDPEEKARMREAAKRLAENARGIADMIEGLQW